MRQLSFWHHGDAEPTPRRCTAEKAPPPAPRPMVVVQPPSAAGTAASQLWQHPEQLAEWLQDCLCQPVHVVFTRSTSTMLSSSRRHGVVRLRLHEMFREAGEREAHALRKYLAGQRGRADKAAGKIINDFIAAHVESITHSEPDVRQQGRYHHLGKIFQALNDAHFHGACDARITWGPQQDRRRRRSIQLGCYVQQLNLIRVHPSLDQIFVPRYYVEWVVFHEMLHEVFGFEENNGRRCAHPPAFSALEQTFQDYPAAKRWEEQNIHRLLRYRPLRVARDGD